MDTQAIIAALEERRDRINQAIAALQSKGRTTPSVRKKDRRRRPLTAEQKKRIGEAMKKKWAERKGKT